MNKNHKNILIVCHYYPPHVGGIEIVAQKQATSLRQLGNKVTVVTSANPATPGTTRDNGIRIHRIAAWNILEDRFGVPIPIFSPKLITQLWKVTASADVVHLHDVFYATSWVAFMFARLRSKPVFLTQHVALVDHPSPAVMAFQHVTYRLAGSPIFRACKAAIAYNHNVKQFLLARGTDPAKVIELRNGVDLEQFKPAASADEKQELRRQFGLPTDKPLALFVGRLVPKKGANAVYDARSASYDLVFAGSGAIPAGWQDTPGVHALGPQTQAKLVQLYRLSDVFVFPARGEMLTLVMQEAAASGLPIITTDEPAYREYDLDRTLIRFVKPEATELKKAIKAVLADDKLRHRMSQYSLHLAEQHFDWDKNIRRAADLYSNPPKTERNVVVTTSWDDGHTLDLKLAAMLREHGVAATFYITPKNREFKPSELLTDAQVKVLSRHFEIGAHTMTHPHLTKIPLGEARTEITNSKAYLEKLLDKPVTTFCYPAGFYNADHARIAREAGYKLARTVKRFNFNPSATPYELETSIHTYDHWTDLWRIARFARFNPIKFLRYARRWDNLAIAMFDRVSATGGTFHLWGHSWELEQRGEWDRLSRVLAHIGNRPATKYLTNGELV